MWIVRLALSRPYTFVVMAILIAILGGSAVMTMPVDIFKALLNERSDDLKFFVERVDKECIVRLEKFVESSFERMTYMRPIAPVERNPPLEYVEIAR